MLEGMINEKRAIITAIHEAKIDGFTGEYTSLGGGLLNHTFLLKFADKDLVLRIAKRSDQESLLLEANSLKQLSIERVPQLIYFDKQSKIEDSMWVLETFVAGKSHAVISTDEYGSLGELLAKIHSTPVKQPDHKLDFWSSYISESKRFGNEEFFIQHPDKKLRNLIKKAKDVLVQNSNLTLNCQHTIVHGDVSPSNTLFQDGMAGLIDWEFSRVKDPMADFSTMYYEDLEFFRGQWKAKLPPDKINALHEGYKQAGGMIDNQRLQLWMMTDKLGSATFLYWRLHQSDWQLQKDDRNVHESDYENLLESLEMSL